MCEANEALRVTVMGLGLFGGGVGVVRHFASRGHAVRATDLRSRETLAPAVSALDGLDVRYIFGEHRDDDFTDCDVLVVNPGVKPGNRYVALAEGAGARVTTELELGLELASERSARVVGVSGSNGKSTTATMLASILKAWDPRTCSGGNLGGSLLDCAGSIPSGAPLVLELSSFQLQRLSSFPGLQVAALTNLSPNHLDWHPSIEHYYAAKKRLLEFLPRGGTAVLNHDDEILRAWHEDLDCGVRWFSMEDHPELSDCVYADDLNLRRRSDSAARTVATLQSVAVHGPHDLMNAAAAAACAIAFGADDDAVAAGLQAYQPLNHRLQVVAECDGFTFVDDSCSTTPESSALALVSVQAPVSVIVGGSDKGIPFAAFGEALCAKAVGVSFLGLAGERIRECVVSAAERSGCSIRMARAESLEDAFEKALAFLPDGGTLLLSPAAASLDTFANYARRGDAFADLARDWVRRGEGKGELQ